MNQYLWKLPSQQTMTIAQAQAPRISVYLHCSSIFTGANARVRKTKNVRKLLEKNKHSFRALTSEYNLGTICNVAKELLDAGIFESTSKAQTQFLNCSNAPMINGRRRASLPILKLPNLRRTPWKQRYLQKKRTSKRRTF